MNISSNQIEPLSVAESEQTNQIKHWLGKTRLISILTIYAFLVFYHIDHQSLWVDEVLSLQNASPHESFSNRLLWFPGQGPLYFVVLHFWAKLGSSEIWLRSLSALCGFVAVYFAYAVGIRLFHDRTAWVGATLFATSPFLIWYGQEVRYIALMIMTSLCAMYVFHRALSTHRLGWWIACCCSMLVAIAAFLTNILLPVIQGLYLLCSSSGRHVFRKWLVWQMPVFVLFVWWANGCSLSNLGGYWEALYLEIAAKSEELSHSDSSDGLTIGGDRKFTLATLPYTFFTFSTGFSMGPSVRDLQLSRSLATLMPHLGTLTILSVLFGGLFVSGLMDLRRRAEIGKFLLIWLIVPILGVLAASGVSGMTYNVRYVASALPPFTLIMAAGVVGLRRSWLQSTLLGLALLANGVSLANYYFDPHYAREDSRHAAKYLESAASPRDAIRVVGDPTGIQHYYQGELPIEIWSREGNNDGFLVSGPSREPSKNYDCLWLVEIRPWQGPRTKVKTLLQKLYPLIQYQRFAGVEIYAYDLSRLKSANVQ